MIKEAPEELPSGTDAHVAGGDLAFARSRRIDGPDVGEGEGEVGTMALRERRRRPDEKKSKFKVQIGATMGCTCRSKEDGPCMHLLFVLVKLLRVPA